MVLLIKYIDMIIKYVELDVSDLNRFFVFLFVFNFMLLSITFATLLLFLFFRKKNG